LQSDPDYAVFYGNDGDKDGFVSFEEYAKAAE